MRTIWWGSALAAMAVGCGSGANSTNTSAADAGSAAAPPAVGAGQPAAAPAALVRIRVGLTGDGEGQVTSSPAGIDCPNGRCEMNVPTGTMVTLTARATGDSALSAWAGACTRDPCSFVASADADVFAGFAATRFTLTIQVVGPGRVQSSPAGIDCPGQCSAKFDAHSVVEVHATPDAGNYFHDWGTACGDSYGVDCPIFLHRDYSATAAFSSTQRFFKLIIYQSGYGNGRVRSSPPGIDCGTDSPGCSGQFTWGTQVTLTATAAPGSTFAGWRGSCAAAGPCVVEVKTNRFATVTFDAPPPSGGRYTVRELPAVDQNGYLTPYAMNSRGDIVGSVTILQHGGSPPLTHAFFYDAIAGTSMRIGDDGTYDQVATGINDARQVSLDTMGADGERHVYRWDAGALTPVAGPSDCSIVVPSGIDAKGNVYGGDAISGNPCHAYVWDGSLHDLGISNGAMPPDSSGRIYGTATSSDGTHLVEFAGGAVRDYGVPFAGFIWGKVSAGVMAGTIDPDFMLETAYLYALPNGPFSAPLGIRAGQFNAVNTRGDVVGSLDDTNQPQRAILVQNGGLIDLTVSLNDPAWLLIGATAINDQGQIAGYGYKNGQRTAFLLTPARD